MVPEYQQRVIDERSALERKAKDLSKFIGYSPIFEELYPIDQELLKEQCEVMWLYYEILSKRIQRFN